MPHADPAGLPSADPSRFLPVAGSDLLLAWLGTQKAAATRKATATKLKGLMPPAQVAAAVTQLAARGLVELETKPKGRGRAAPNPDDAKVHLTQAGQDTALALLGSAAKATWAQVLQRRILPLCLGLDPNGGDILKLLDKPDGRRAAIIAVAFGLPTETVGLDAVCEELVWRTLKAGLGPVLGTGRLPMIRKPGITEWVILAGLGGLRGHCPSTPATAKTKGLEALTGAALGLAKADDKTATTRVIALALAHGAAPDTTGPDISALDAALDAALDGASRAPTAPPQRSHPPEPATSPPAPAGIDAFAERVRQVAEALTTPPFQGRVAIAQVYDAYGRAHPDAGALQSFKDRLIAAAQAQRLKLERLDMPERMDRDLRLRSEAAWGRDCVHFVITNRR